MPRRVFDKDFKVAAVKLILEDEMDAKTVSEQLDIYSNSLCRWVSRYEKYGKETLPGNGTRIHGYQAGIHRLSKRNRELEEELELLKNPGSS